MVFYIREIIGLLLLEESNFKQVDPFLGELKEEKISYARLIEYYKKNALFKKKRYERLIDRYEGLIKEADDSTFGSYIDSILENDKSYETFLDLYYKIKSNYARKGEMLSNLRHFKKSGIQVFEYNNSVDGKKRIRVIDDEEKFSFTNRSLRPDVIHTDGEVLLTGRNIDYDYFKIIGSNYVLVDRYVMQDKERIHQYALSLSNLVFNKPLLKQDELNKYSYNDFVKSAVDVSYKGNTEKLKREALRTLKELVKDLSDDVQEEKANTKNLSI